MAFIQEVVVFKSGEFFRLKRGKVFRCQTSEMLVFCVSWHTSVLKNLESQFCLIIGMIKGHRATPALLTVGLRGMIRGKILMTSHKCHIISTT